jgi:translation initiation factor 5A
MTTKNVTGSSLKVGSYLMMEGAACKISDIQISRPGKHGHAKMRIEGSGVVDGKRRVLVMPAHDNIEVPIIDKLTAQVLSIQGTDATVMDSETYETFDLKIPEELKDTCVAGVSILYWRVLDDKIMKQVKSGEDQEE